MYRMLSILFVCAVVFFAASYTNAQVIFLADFEENSVVAIPNQGVNDLNNWVPENPGQIWDYTDAFPNGSRGLLNTVEGCGNSGNTPLPGVDNFTDGIIQLEMSCGDDDSWGVILRQTAADKGYLVVFGYIETPAVIIALLDKGCATVGNCLDQTGCENNPDNTLAQEPHGFDAGALTMDNTVPYLGRIEARGDTIRVWYAPLADVKDSLADDLGAPLVEIKDATHSSGSVGIWHESQGNCMIDNVLVTGPGLFSSTAVAPVEKMATTWGDLKE